MIALGLLLFVTIYVVVAVLLTWALVRRLKSSQAKWRLAIVMALIFLLIPTGDEIVGRYYFKQLCEKEGGIRVYKAVELGPEYWSEDGLPKFINEKGNLDEAVLDHRYSVRRESTNPSKTLFNIRRTTRYLFVKESSAELASHTSFVYFGGWLLNNIGQNVTGSVCHAELGFYQKFLREVFRRRIG